MCKMEMEKNLKPNAAFNSLQQKDAIQYRVEKTKANNNNVFLNL